ncbi:MFS transporter [Actinomadura macra]|uniref:MFS transporter n=1 Tax=Actinomadura macra TaxID=46164 RepID=UPI000836CB2C|nr:MFS transporter [Actinomadura macra]
MSTVAAAGRATRPAMPWPRLMALFTAAFTAVMTELLPRMSEALDVPEGRVGFLVTGYATASFAAAIPVTAALRGLSRRPVLIGTLAGFAVCNAVTAVSSSYVLTFGARLLAGVMGGTLWAMLVGYAARMVPAERRGRAIAVVLAGITVALSLGIPAGTAVASALGWRATFALLAALGIVPAGWVRWKVPNFPGEPPTERTPLRRVATLPGIRSVLLVTLLLLLGHQVMYTYMAPFADQAGFGRAGLVLLVFGLSTVGGVWLTGVLIDRLLRTTLVCALLLLAASMLTLGLAGDVPAVLLATVAVWGVAFGGAPTLIQTALVNASGTVDADVATSMQTTVYNAGIAGGSLLGGVLLEGTGSDALPWTALPLVAASLAVVITARRHAFP